MLRTAYHDWLTRLSSVSIDEQFARADGCTSNYICSTGSHWAVDTIGAKLDTSSLHQCPVAGTGTRGPSSVNFFSQTWRERDLVKLTVNKQTVGADDRHNRKYGGSRIAGTRTSEVSPSNCIQLHKNQQWQSCTVFIFCLRVLLLFSSCPQGFKKMAMLQLFVSQWWCEKCRSVGLQPMAGTRTACLSGQSSWELETFQG